MATTFFRKECIKENITSPPHSMCSDYFAFIPHFWIQKLSVSLLDLCALYCALISLYWDLRLSGKQKWQNNYQQTEPAFCKLMIEVDSITVLRNLKTHFQYHWKYFWNIDFAIFLKSKFNYQLYFSYWITNEYVRFCICAIDQRWYKKW